MNRTIDVTEIGIFKISKCLLGSHLEFQVPVFVQLPLTWIEGQKSDDGNFDYFVFKVKDDWSI